MAIQNFQRFNKLDLFKYLTVSWLASVDKNTDRRDSLAADLTATGM